MQLKDRKRINNIPRFNSGFDSNTAFKSISEGVKNNSGTGSNLIVKDYFAKNNANDSSFKFKNDSYEKLNKEVSNMKLPKLSTGFKIPKQLINGVIDNGSKALGDLFSQSDKFTDSTSNDIRNYGGIISKVIPGKYGKLAGDLLDMTSNAIGIYNYHHNAVWAYETLDYMIFVEHAKEFYQLTEEEQWEIRNLMGALKKIYK